MESNPEPNKLRKWFMQYQFNWVGRTKDGVNRWMGAPRGPSERMCKYMTYYGVAAGTVSLCAALTVAIRPQMWPGLLVLVLVGGIHGLVFMIIGRWLLNMKRRLARLKTAEEMAEEFGSTLETVQRLAEAHSIRAQININNVNLYDPEEFIASRSLLRGASAPVAPDTLLRAAEPTGTSSPPETLLRPGDLPPVGLTPIQQLYFAPEEKTVETNETVQSLRH